MNQLDEKGTRGREKNIASATTSCGGQVQKSNQRTSEQGNERMKRMKAKQSSECKEKKEFILYLRKQSSKEEEENDSKFAALSACKHTHNKDGGFGYRTVRFTYVTTDTTSPLQQIKRALLLHLFTFAFGRFYF